MDQVQAIHDTMQAALEKAAWPEDLTRQEVADIKFMLGCGKNKFDNIKPDCNRYDYAYSRLEMSIKASPARAKLMAIALRMHGYKAFCNGTKVNKKEKTSTIRVLYHEWDEECIAKPFLTPAHKLFETYQAHKDKLKVGEKRSREEDEEEEEQEAKKQRIEEFETLSEVINKPPYAVVEFQDSFKYVVHKENFVADANFKAFFNKLYEEKPFEIERLGGHLFGLTIKKRDIEQPGVLSPLYQTIVDNIRSKQYVMKLSKGEKETIEGAILMCIDNYKGYDFDDKNYWPRLECDFYKHMDLMMNFHGYGVKISLASVSKTIFEYRRPMPILLYPDFTTAASMFRQVKGIREENMKGRVYEKTAEESRVEKLGSECLDELIASLKAEPVYVSKSATHERIVYKDLRTHTELQLGKQSDEFLCKLREKRPFVQLPFTTTTMVFLYSLAPNKTVEDGLALHTLLKPEGKWCKEIEEVFRYRGQMDKVLFKPTSGIFTIYCRSNEETSIKTGILEMLAKMNIHMEDFNAMFHFAGFDA